MAISSPIKKSPFIKQLSSIGTIANNILLTKQKTIGLEFKFYKVQKLSAQKKKLKLKEFQQENKQKTKKTIASKVVEKKQIGIGGFLFNLITFFVQYKIIEWVSKKENIKKVEGILKALKGIFDFLSWFIGGTIDNTLSGLSDLVGGGTILERFVGFFRLLVGLLGIRYLLNPFKLIKDLGFVIKNSGKILDIFKSFKNSGITEGAEKLLKTLPKTAQIFKHGLSRALSRSLLKIFGRGGVGLLSKFLGPAINATKNFILAPIKGFAKKTVAGIPIVGPLLDLGINLILGDPLDKAIIKAAGSALGMGLGGLVGSILPGPGTIVGGLLGGIVGYLAASKLYDWLKGMFSKQEKVPELATGGIVTQPTKAIIGEAGPEAVIPLGQIFSLGVINAPLKMIASALLGGMNALISSLGSVGLLVRPVANQLMAPYVREFAVNTYAYSSNLGTGAEKSIVLKPDTSDNDTEIKKIIGKDKDVITLKNKDENKKNRYNSGNSVREILADILNNVLNLDFKSPAGGGRRGGRGGSGDPDTGGGGSLSGDPADFAAVKASPAEKKAAAHLATLEATGDQNVADVYQVILNRAATQSGGIKSVITAKEQFAPYSAAIYGSSADGAAASKYGKLGLTKEEIFELAAKEDGIQQLTTRFKAGNAGSAAKVLRDFESNGTLSKEAKSFVKGSQYFMGYKVTANDRKRGAGGNWFRDRYQTGGVVNPIPSQNIASNKGGYAADTGLDILTPIGSRVVSPVSGILEYAEKGHVRQMGQDANPNLPGMQDQHSVRIKLDKPFTFAGKKVNFFYATHLYQLNNSIANKSGTKITAGDFLGLSGVANKVPHVHVGFVQDREQNSFLNYRQVISLLSGAPVKDAGDGETSGSGDHGPTGSDPSGTVTDGSEESQGPIWSEIATELGKLYNRMVPSAPKLDSQALSTNSMDWLQSLKSTPLGSDTYIMTPGSTQIVNTNIISPLPQIDYTKTSFSMADSSTHYNRNL